MYVNFENNMTNQKCNFIIMIKFNFFFMYRVKKANFSQLFRTPFSLELFKFKDTKLNKKQQQQLTMTMKMTAGKQKTTTKSLRRMEIRKFYERKRESFII